MKRLSKVLLAGLLVCLVTALAGCSSYSEEYKEGPWGAILNRDEEKCFLANYTWDGTEEGLYIKPSEEYDGCKCTRIGGHSGRGVPTPFTVLMSGMEQSREPAKGSKMTEVVFTLYIGENITDISLNDYPMYWRKQNEDGTHEFYCVKIKEEPDPKSRFYTGDAQ